MFIELFVYSKLYRQRFEKDLSVYLFWYLVEKIGAGYKSKIGQNLASVF